MEGVKKALWAALRGVEMAVEAVGGESAKLKAFGGEPRRHILGDTFFNQLPVRYGDNTRQTVAGADFRRTEGAH